MNSPGQHSRATLCIVVDDFGLHAGVNRAAQSLVELGRVHAVGTLVGAPAFAEGSAPLRRLGGPDLDIGLHLDFTEAPLLRRSCRPLPELVAAAFMRSLDARLLRGEIRAQLDAFETALGQRPAFVDGHQHVHQLPGIREELMAELMSRYPGRLPWLRCTRGAKWSLKAWLIEALGGRRACALAVAQGFAHNRRLLGVYDFRGGRSRYLALLTRWLDSAGEGDLLMCHAGTGSPADDALAAARETEYAVLADARFPGLLQWRGIALRPMSRILSRSAE